jgi:ribosome biogenesis GTPase / thiamine phosphate phosphatase
MNLLDTLPIDTLRAIGLNPRVLAQLPALDLRAAHDVLAQDGAAASLADVPDAPDAPDAGGGTPGPSAPPDHDPPSTAGADGPRIALMRLIEVQRESVRLHDGLLEHPARLLPALRHQLAAVDDAVGVGDWVVAARNRHAQWWVVQRLPPLSQIARRLHDGRDKVSRTVIASNVDTALLVQGLDGDFNLRRLERYLALARLAGVTPVVVLTKADLCVEVAARVRAVQALLPADGAVVALDALGAQPRARLAPWLSPGTTLVLLGSSGVGKSTLTNALTGAAQGSADTATVSSLQRTGGTRTGDGRGRHTTTARTLHRTPEGACIIDTPGLRTLRLDTPPEELADSFEDIARLAMQCRFSDCRHESEPGCAVRTALPPQRLHNFHKLMREARRDTMTVLERQAQHAQWRIRSKAARRRDADTRAER